MCPLHMPALIFLVCFDMVSLMAADSYVVPAWIGTSGYSLRPPDIEDPNFDEALLAESPEDLGGVGIRPPSGPSKRTNGAKVEGLALLKEDLHWLSRLLLAALSWLLKGVKVIHADILAWATAFVSFRLTRALLKGTNQDQAAEKAVEQVEVESEAETRMLEEVPKAADETAEEWQRLVSKAQREERDAFGCSLLHLAAHHGQIQATKQLLEMGFDPNATEHSKETPLHMAARAGCVGSTQLLLAFRAEPEARNCFGKTALAVATHSNHADAAGVLRAAAKQF
ncbi:secG [Symbiodinium natans]|uniref:SecG protein n=1 Tax=Symbiodinium natans TaxID=878477 RepID=A0A812PLX3_9DINO|nr:secG [Symbiodinium natans]